MARLRRELRSQRETNCPQSNRGAGWARPKSWVVDPKPVDLFLDRLKPGETQVEDRTDIDVQIIRMIWV